MNDRKRTRQTAIDPRGQRFSARSAEAINPVHTRKLSAPLPAPIQSTVGT